MKSTRPVNCQIFAGSENLTKKDLLHIIGLAEGDELYVANKVILKALCMISITVFWLTHLLF